MRKRPLNVDRFISESSLYTCIQSLHSNVGLCGIREEFVNQTFGKHYCEQLLDEVTNSLRAFSLKDSISDSVPRFVLGDFAIWASKIRQNRQLFGQISPIFRPILTIFLPIFDPLDFFYCFFM